MTRIDAPMTNRTRSADGTPIAWFSSGEGPPLVLVHGVLGDHTRWEVLRPLLEPHFTVHAMDRRGRGASGDADAYGFEREFEDVAAVVDAVAAATGSPVDVYGHSGGASFALGAASLTTRLRRLVLYEPALDPGNLLPDGLLERIDALLAAGDPDAVVETFCRAVLHMDDDAIATYRAQPSWPARVAAAHTLPRELRSGPAGFFDRRRLAQVTVPVMLLQGTQTPKGFKAALAGFAATLPDARVADLEGQAHTADVLAPHVVAQELIAFLR
jgi:pimeloyl-ACP methyl ester carboxylesterase